MQQCQSCRRLGSNQHKSCVWCGKTCEPVTAGQLGPEQDEELANYKVNADYVSIDGIIYRIEKAIGQGGHGVVLAVRHADGSGYALKVPLEFNEQFSNNQGNKPSLLELSRRYMKHEVEMVTRITCDALLKTIYAGPVTCKAKDHSATFPAILMERAEGTLKNLLDSHTAHRLHLPYDEKKAIIKGITAAAETLHKQSVVHRDLSPHNIFLVDRGGKITYLLGDMGTSKPTAPYDSDNSTTRMAFHNRYLDPAIFIYEKFRYNCRIDIYQLGVIITEVLMGQYWQSDDEDTADMGFQSVDFEKDFLRKYAAVEMDAGLLEVLAKATTLKINRRFASAGKMRLAIQHALPEHNERDGSIIKKNIAICYQRSLPNAGDRPGVGTDIKPVVTIFDGRRRIDMQSADTIEIRFPNINLNHAAIIEPSFLKCSRSSNKVSITIDAEAIRQTVKPLLKPSLRSFRFDGESILTIRGVPE